MNPPFDYKNTPVAVHKRPLYYLNKYKHPILIALIATGLLVYYLLNVDTLAVLKKSSELSQSQFKPLQCPVVSVCNATEIHLDGLPELRFHNSSKPFKQEFYQHLQELGLLTEHKWVDLSQRLPSVKFVSAVSENHAAEGRDLVLRMSKVHPMWTIYMYDIGLTKKTREWFERACNVEMRDIDLKHFGVNSNLFLYQWKPLIVAKALSDFPVVFWMDSSTFWAENATITGFLNKIDIAGDKEGPNVYLLDKAHHSTFAVTQEGMYTYLAPQGDIYRKQSVANKQLWIRTKSTYENALKWWVLCALEINCMAPPGHLLYCHFDDKDPIRIFGKCNRYDQSAINIILSKHPKSFLEDWVLKYAWTDRGKISKEILFCILIYLVLFKEEEPSNIPELRYFNSSKTFDTRNYRLLNELGVLGRIHFVNLSKPLPPVTLVSAVSENHAGEGRSLVVRLAKEHPKWKLYLYDLGLEAKTKAWFESACNVELRTIDLKHYDVHRDLFTYQWKPIIIATALKEFPIVFWLDTSTYIAPNATFDELLKNISIAQEGPHAYLLDSTGHSTYAVTNNGMYDYLFPQGNSYKEQYQANKMLFVRTRSTHEHVLKWFVLCALEPNCMAPFGHRRKCQFGNDRYRKYDQSAVNIILQPYTNSFLGNWSYNFAWTDRNKEAKEDDIVWFC